MSALEKLRETKRNGLKKLTEDTFGRSVSSDSRDFPEEDPLVSYVSSSLKESEKTDFYVETANRDFSESSETALTKLTETKNAYLKASRLVVEAAIETRVDPATALSFFEDIDWRDMIYGRLEEAEIRKIVAYAREVS